MPDSNKIWNHLLKPTVNVCRKRGNEFRYLTLSSSSSSSVNPCSFGDFYLFFVLDSSLSSPVLSWGRTRLVSGKHCLGTCFDSNVKLPWLVPQRRSFGFSSNSHAYLSSPPSQVFWNILGNTMEPLGHLGTIASGRPFRSHDRLGGPCSGSNPS